MTLRLLVLLAGLALLGWRFRRRTPMSWSVPLVLGATIVVVRGIAYALGEGR